MVLKVANLQQLATFPKGKYMKRYPPPHRMGNDVKTFDSSYT